LSSIQYARRLSPGSIYCGDFPHPNLDHRTPSIISPRRSQLLDGLPGADDRDGATGRVGEGNRVHIDPEVAVQRRQEIFRTDASFNRLFRPGIGRTDHLAGADASASEEHRVGLRPMDLRLEHPGAHCRKGIGGVADDRLKPVEFLRYFSGMEWMSCQGRGN
jgi:hypothetical protein